MSPAEIQNAAEWLVEARLSGRTATALPAAEALGGEEGGYLVQSAGYAVLSAKGFGGLAGYKIGCTNAAVQDQLGVPGPAFGGIVASNLHERSAEISRERLQCPGIECEIAFRVDRDLGAEGSPFDRDTVRPYVASCSAAMEIVDNRYGDVRKAPFGLMIADDFFQSACVLGPPVDDWRALDLADTVGSTLVNGEVMGTGKGANVMGHPLEPLAWLANRLLRQGRCLEAGQVVITGTMVDPVWLDLGPCEAAVTVAGLGEATASFL